MSLTALVIGGALLLAMICVSLYGRVALPSDARMPVHFGPTGYNRWVSKNTGLAMYPGIGVVVYVIIIVSLHDRGANGGLGPVTGLSIALGVMLVAQIGALAVALHRSRRG
jgi:hypothetical protein